jgi:hypothetical protein
VHRFERTVAFGSGGGRAAAARFGDGPVVSAVARRAIAFVANQSSGAGDRDDPVVAI